ncbi:MAG: T9SS type A sorting domain-containing protein [Bacteroidetes bacterium]|nr:T9SS type A sorting domain-containing protein [Bacteroidota bacterium]HET6245880.1 T9SS type A sorting domain-containing protein [Bacteroidia bacterium]
MKKILLIIILLASFYEATACHDATLTQLSAVDNGNNTYTYQLRVCFGTGAGSETYGFWLNFSGGNLIGYPSSVTGPTTGNVKPASVPPVSGTGKIEYGDWDNTGSTLLSGALNTDCLTLTLTFDAPITSATFGGIQPGLSCAAKTITTTSCFAGFANYTVAIQSDNCGGNISFNFKNASGTTILSQTGLSSNGTLYSYSICAGCAETFTINAPAVTTGPSQCPAGLCCGNGNGYYTVYDATGAVIVSSTMQGLATQTTNVSVCFVLPIELISFDANALENEIVLEWVTATEVNNDYFTIERSSNGVDFIEIDKVAGAGNSSVIKSYKYIDRPNSKGIFYYRLTQTDYDNTSIMTDIVAVEAKKVFGNNKIYPNPASGSINFIVESMMDDPIGEVVVLDISGKVMISEKIIIKKGVNATSLNVTSLPPGIYFTSVKHNEEVIKGRFVKN